MSDLDLVVVSYRGLAINDGVNYVAGFSPGLAWGLPDVEVMMAERSGSDPIVSHVQPAGDSFVVFVRIAGADVRGLRDDLLRAANPLAGSAAFVVEDEDGTNERYRMALCRRCRPQLIEGEADQLGFELEMVTDGDTRWRSVSETVDVWAITASGQTRVIANGGSDDAYPVYRFKPISAKGSGYVYACWAPIQWPASKAGQQHPICIVLDTAAPVAAGKMQADGDDLRVFVDGVEVHRWLSGMNSDSTKIWFNADWAAGQALTLKTAIAPSGPVSSIEVNEDITGFPAAGTVYIEDEAFVYTDRNVTERKFTGITRAAKNTGEEAHSIGATVHWMQHDVWIMYGNASAGAPTVDDDYKPAFDLASSTNTSWVYTEFGDSGEKRAGRWQRWGAVATSGDGGVYTATQRTLASPYSVAGAWLGRNHGNAYGWSLTNPCGIVNAAWSGGKKRAATTSNFLVHLMYWVRGASWWTWQATLSNPTMANTWEAWSEPAAGSPWAAADTLALAAYFHAQDVEVSAVTVTLNSSETPVVSVGVESGNYELDCTLTNETTGESMQVSFSLPLNEEIEVDTGARTVTFLKDGSSQFQALELVGDVRREWLRLEPGNNVLRFDEADVAGVTVTTMFRKRDY